MVKVKKYSERIGETSRNCKILRYFKSDKQRCNGYYELKCKCDNIFTASCLVVFSKVYKDLDLTCGCEKRITTNGRKVKKLQPEDNIGKTIRSVEILRFLDPVSGNTYLGKYEVRCSCGVVFKISHTHLFKKSFRNVKASCGCFREEPKRHKREYERVTYNRYFNYSKYRAKRKNLEFNLTLDDYIKIAKNPCNYCGRITLRNTYMVAQDPWTKVFKGKGEWIIEVQNDRASEIDKYTTECSGIDRVDSNKGYLLDNIVPCCTSCNTLKSNLTLEEFLDKCIRFCDRNEEYKNIVDFMKLKSRKLN